jgi:hypothetical protein
VCSSAMAFDGFSEGGPRAAEGAEESIVVQARSWLLTTGWRRHRLIDPFEVPRCQQQAAKHSPPKRIQR